MSIFKSDEQRALEKARKAKEEQDRIILQIEQQAQARQARKDQAIAEYQRKLAAYRTDCELVGANLKPSHRLILMFGSIRNIRAVQDWDKVIADYELTEVFQKIDQIGTPPRQPPPQPDLSQYDKED